MSFCWLLGVSKIDTLTIVVLGGGPNEGLLGCLLTARSAARLMSFPGANATCTFGWAHGGPDGAGNGAGANAGTGAGDCPRREVPVDRKAAAGAGAPALTGGGIAAFTKPEGTAGAGCGAGAG